MSISKVRFSRCAQVSGAVGGSVWALGACVGLTGCFADDNNGVENAIRPFAVGRKNWLFSDSQAGARASANIYSLLETARANGLIDYAYLKLVLTDLPTMQGKNLHQLLPWNVTEDELGDQMEPGP